LIYLHENIGKILKNIVYLICFSEEHCSI